MEIEKIVQGTLPERLERPQIVREHWCALCARCSYARVGDFCCFSDGTCLRIRINAIAQREQKTHKKRLEAKR